MKSFYTCVFLCLAVLLTSPVSAMEMPWERTDHLQARLLTGALEKEENGKIILEAGLELQLAENWHAYWRTPGDAGLPPRLNWENSVNIAQTEIFWPAPQRIDAAGFYSFGYHDRVLFPLDLYLQDKNGPSIIDVSIDILVCKDICVPQHITLRAELSPEDYNDTITAKILKTAQEALPHKENVPSLKIESAVVGPEAIVVNAFSQNGYKHIDLFIECEDIYITAPPEITLDKTDPRKAMLRLQAPEGTDNLARLVSGRSIILTLTDGQKAIEKEITP